MGQKQNLEEQTQQGPEESDSDIEALRETKMLEGGAEGRHKKKTPDFQAAPLDGAAWEKLQLLARVKSIMTKKSEQEEKEDMLDDDDEDVRLAEDASPGTVGAASPYAGRRSQQKFTPTDLDYLHSSKGGSSPGSRHAPKRKIMLKVVDHAQHVLDARVKVGDQLSVLFNAFTKQASDKVRIVVFNGGFSSETIVFFFWPSFRYCIIYRLSFSICFFALIVYCIRYAAGMVANDELQRDIYVE